MKKSFFLITAIFIVVSFVIPHHTYAQDSTFAFKLNGHKYNQKEDLMIRAIQEWFVIAMDSLDLPSLINTLAADNGLTINEFIIPEKVEVDYQIDESFDFIGNITLDSLSISANYSAFSCDLDISIKGAGFRFGGMSEYVSGVFKVNLGDPEIREPDISVVGSGLCILLEDTLKSAIRNELNGALLGLAQMFKSESFDELLSFLNPIQSLGIKDSVLIEQALESFPMDMDLYTEEDPILETTQLIIEINFLLGTVDNPQAFVGIEPSEITDSQLETGGFSFLYWVLQKSFPWHNDWTESQRVNEALNITNEVGFKDYRIELRWSDLQKLAYSGGELDPAGISPENIDSLVADTEHWDTTAFGAVEEYLDNGFTLGLEPFMVVGVGHEDRTPLDMSELNIAPATETWDPTEGYTGVSANEYLYNLKTYAHATVKRFADDIDVWQIENELNAAGFAAADPEWWRKGDLWQDAEFRNQVWDVLVNAVHTEDPTALILHDLHMLGFMQGLEEWVDDIDIVGINYYPNQVTSLPVMGFTVGEYVWAVRRALKGLGYEDKPVWITETGYPGIEIEDPSDNIILADDIAYFSEYRQEEYIETALSSAVTNGAKGFFYYSLVTQDDFPGDIPEPMRFSGMVRRETDVYKPALQTYADLYKSLLIEPTGIDDGGAFLPKNTSLHQNYPNPFNPTTVIRYHLAVNSTLQIEIFNLQGQLIETLFSGRQESGSHEVEWNAGHLASGVYYYRLKTENFLDVKKMILIK